MEATCSTAACWSIFTGITDSTGNGKFVVARGADFLFGFEDFRDVLAIESELAFFVVHPVADLEPHLDHTAHGVDLAGRDASLARGVERFADHVEAVAYVQEARQGIRVGVFDKLGEIGELGVVAAVVGYRNDYRPKRRACRTYRKESDGRRVQRSWE